MRRGSLLVSVSLTTLILSLALESTPLGDQMNTFFGLHEL